MKSFCLGVMYNDLHHEGASIAALTRCPGYFEIAVRPENDLLRPGPMRLLGLCEGFCALDAEMIAFVADGIVGLYFGDSCPVVELRRRTQTYSPARWLETNYFPLLPACQQNSQGIIYLTSSVPARIPGGAMHPIPRRLPRDAFTLCENGDIGGLFGQGD